MIPKARVGDKVTLNKSAKRALRQRYGNRTGVVKNLSSKNRALYIVHFDNGHGTDEALWSYEFDIKTWKGAVCSVAI